MLKKTASILVLSLGVATAGNATADERDVWPFVAGIAVGAVAGAALSGPPQQRRPAPVLYAAPPVYPVRVRYAAPPPATVYYVPVQRRLGPPPGYRFHRAPHGHWGGYR